MAVLINGRTAVHKYSKGKVTTQDTCYTGPQQQAVTYQNIAKSADTENAAKSVFINGNPICHKNSYFSKSYGSEAGNGGGVQSGKICDKAEFTTSSSNVFIEGTAAVRQGDLMVSNNRNTPPAPLQQKGVPYGGDQEKINKFPLMPYPALEFNLSLLPLIQFTSGIVATTYEVITLELNGTINIKKNGETNPLTFELSEYKMNARQSLSTFCGNFTVISFGSNQVGIGSSETGEFWSTSVELQSPNKLIYDANQQPIGKQYADWIISGQLGFTLTIETHHNPFTPIVIPLPNEVLQIGIKIGKKILTVLVDEIIAIWAEG